MARPTKRGLEYFPLDVDMEADSAVAFVEAKHGLEGYAVFVRLLQRIYRDGYYLAWDDRELYIFARSVAVPVDRVAAVVDDCLSERLFDLELFKKYGVLTSRGIQSRYVSATGRRAGVEMQEELLLLDKKTITSSHITVIDTYTGTLVSADIKIVIDDVMLTETLHSEVIDDMMLTETPQSKVKESRVLKNLSSFENDGDEYFDRFWLSYPKKIGKKAARMAWKRAKPDKEPTEPSIVPAVIEYLNERAGTRYRASSGKTQKLIGARVNEGFGLDDMKAVIDVKCDQWRGTDMDRYLRPETLFGSKFEGYLQERRKEVGGERGNGKRLSGFKSPERLLSDGL